MATLALVEVWCRQQLCLSAVGGHALLRRRRSTCQLQVKCEKEELTQTTERQKKLLDFPPGPAPGR